MYNDAIATAADRSQSCVMERRAGFCISVCYECALCCHQAHCQRTTLPSDLVADQKQVLEPCVRLLHALVDVIASNGWLIPALAAMEISQALVQAVLHAGSGEQNKLQASPLRQLPHFSADLVKAANGQYTWKNRHSCKA